MAIYPTKHIKSKEKYDLPRLVREVRNLKLKSEKDLIAAALLSDLIVKEWIRLKDSRNKIRSGRKIDNKKEAYLEAKGEIVVSLLCLINEKILLHRIMQC